MRKQFEMTKEDLAAIMDASKPVPMIMLHLGTPSSPQENANRAWQTLAKKLGFVWDTVQEIQGKPQTMFSAEKATTEDDTEEPTP